MNVKIKSGSMPFGTKVTTADGAEIDGLNRIAVTIDVDDINRAELHLAISEIEVEASARVYVGGNEVRRIEYADGKVVEYPAPIA